jgi:hypothetical protein
MIYRVLADLTLLLHLAFIFFVLLGGLLCLHRTLWAWVHLPAATWGIWVEWSGRICPLTPLENHFRRLASGQGYKGGFVEHYLVPVVYPNSLNSSVQLLLGFIVIIINLFIYLYVLNKLSKSTDKVDE